MYKAYTQIFDKFVKDGIKSKINRVLGNHWKWTQNIQIAMFYTNRIKALRLT